MNIIKKYGYTLLLAGLLMVLSIILSALAKSADNTYPQTPLHDLSEAAFGAGLILVGVQGTFFPEGLLKRGFKSRLAYTLGKSTPTWHICLSGILTLLVGILIFFSGVFTLFKKLFM